MIGSWSEPEPDPDSDAVSVSDAVSDSVSDADVDTDSCSILSDELRMTDGIKSMNSSRVTVSLTLTPLCGRCRTLRWANIGDVTDGGETERLYSWFEEEDVDDGMMK